MFAGIGSVWRYIPSNGKDVTEEFITSLPRTARTVKASQSTNDIFIVHGRDHKPIRELKELLKELGLNPIVLHEQASGSRTVIEKLEKHSNVGYAFVLLTPDDAGYCQYERRVLSEDFTARIQLKLQKLRSLVRKEHDVNIAEMMKGFVNVLRGRARQNVVFEFGYFIGLLSRDRVCCLYKRDVELPSDIQGIVYIPFEDSIIDVRDEIVKELEHAGYQLPTVTRSLTEKPS